MRYSSALALGLTLMVHFGCALDGDIRTKDDSQTKQLASRLGYAGCKVSDALQIEDVLRQARLDGIVIRDPASLAQKLSANVESGSEIRLIDCSANQGGVREGSRYFVTIRSGALQEVIFDEIQN